MQEFFHAGLGTGSEIPIPTDVFANPILVFQKYGHRTLLAGRLAAGDGRSAPTDRLKEILDVVRRQNEFGIEPMAIVGHGLALHASGQQIACIVVLVIGNVWVLLVGAKLCGVGDLRGFPGELRCKLCLLDEFNSLQYCQ
jgi:hypothetical protein